MKMMKDVIGLGTTKDVGYVIVNVNGQLNSKGPKRFLNYFWPLYHGMNQHGLGMLSDSAYVTLCNAIYVMSINTVLAGSLFESKTSISKTTPLSVW
jgi:hypothetical protein